MAPVLHSKAPVIAPGSIILVTGANGFLASHVVDQLLGAGYQVRGTVRDASKTAWLNELFDKKYGKGNLETVVVEDMAKPGAFDAACKGVSGVVHLASVLTFDSDPNKVVSPSIAGTVNVAESATKEPSVKRFVYCSSSTAITAPRPNEKFVLSTKDWNVVDIEKAWKPPPYEPDRSWAVYGASKAQAEQALWKFVEEKKPGFVVNTILPNMNFGEILSEKQPASSGACVKTIYNGDLNPIKDLPPQWMVNVKDTARLHISGLIDPEVENERILAYAAPYNWNDVLQVLRKLYPAKEFVEDLPDLPRDLSVVDNSRGAELLKAWGRDGWTSFEDSIKENTMHLA